MSIPTEAADSDTSKEGVDDKLVREARARFKRCEDWEATARTRWINDVKFYNGDAYNMYQWPDNARNARGFGTGDERPCLTVNKARQHCLQIVNDARQNKTSVKIKPTGNEATYDAAQVLEGLVRHIEYVSNAQAHYTTAIKFQVQGGIGYLRITTDYVDDTSFDQDIRIGGVADPLSIYLDPDYVESDGADARFGFEFTDMPRDEFEVQYPEFKDRMVSTALGNDEGWIAEKHVRVAGYWWREEVKDTLIVFANPLTGDKTPIKKSDTKGWSGALLEALKEQLADPATKTREILRHQVKWCKIVGDEIVERKDWAGETIPIIPVIGERTVIEGELDRKGHMRSMIDSQRMLNYNASASVEYGALQTKTPWIAPAAAIEGQDAWATANVANYSVLTWNHVDEDGQPIPPPFKPSPPIGAPVYQEGMKNAAEDMMAVSGQYQSLLGEQGNERSGKAIQARQRQGENATYHFIDHQANAIRRVGKIILELVKPIYDTQRLMSIMGEDGTPSDVQFDPNAAQAFEKRKAETEDAAEQVIFNPAIGRYDVMSDVGPDFATRRQEAFNALSQIAASNPELMSIIGDLVLLAADFPLAAEAAERLKRMVPPQALGEGGNPQVMMLQKQVQASGQLTASLSQKLVELQSKLSTKDAQKQVDIYKAITDRLDVLLKTKPSEKDILQWQHDLAMQEHAGNLDLASQAMANELAPEAEEAA